MGDAYLLAGDRRLVVLGGASILEARRCQVGGDQGVILITLLQSILSVVMFWRGR